MKINGAYNAGESDVIVMEERATWNVPEVGLYSKYEGKVSRRNSLVQRRLRPPAARD